MSMNYDLPLERLLMHAAENAVSGSFPDRDLDAWNTYKQVKASLDRDYFSHANAGLAQSGGRYTRHDLRHVNDVILATGRVLGLNVGTDVSGFNTLTPYETYVLLLAILLHDAGNVHGRDQHERRALMILNGLSDITNFGGPERKLVASIAQAHGGRDDVYGKDTIAKLLSNERFADLEIRPRLLAAALKLGDELSENPGRIDPTVLNSGKPEEALPHHWYCKTISVDIDHQGGRIGLSFYVPSTVLDTVMTWEEGQTGCFTDYIARRIEKTDRERRYCNRFLRKVAYFEGVRVRLEIVDEDDPAETVVLTELFEFSDDGYPEPSIKKEDLFERFSGSRLKAELISGKGGKE